MQTVKMQTMLSSVLIFEHFETYSFKIFLILEDRPDHHAEIDYERDDDEHEDGHVVAEARGREDEVKVNGVRLRHETGHK